MPNYTFVPRGEFRVGQARVLILGEPGVGKTRLAATFPHPLFLNFDPDGPASALPTPPPRIDIPTDVSALKTTKGIIDQIADLEPHKDGTVTWELDSNKVKIGTVVLDSIDAVQLAVKSFEILRGRTKMERADWGVLLEKMTPLVLSWNKLPVNLVVVSHVKRREREGSNRIEDAILAVKGALRDEMPSWFSHILHIVVGEKGQRYVITQPMIAKNIRYLAKDRHNTLARLVEEGSKWVPLPGNANGYPSNEIAKAICNPSAAENEAPAKD